MTWRRARRPRTIRQAASHARIPHPDDPAAAWNEAVLLLAERAAAVVPGFAVTKDNQPDVVRLCRRLEGLPLAIELAAARLRELPPAELPPAELAARLDDRLAVLGETEEAVYDAHPPWHQALRTAIGWSNELCTPQERLLWARAHRCSRAHSTVRRYPACAPMIYSRLSRSRPCWARSSMPRSCPGCPPGTVTATECWTPSASTVPSG